MRRRIWRYNLDNQTPDSSSQAPLNDDISVPTYYTVKPLLLVSVHVKIDPIWHDSRIRATFSYLRECDSWSGFPAFLAQQWAHFLDISDDESAPAAAWRYLKLADEIGSEHYRADALLLLCKFLCQREPQTARALVGDFAAQAETLAAARKNNHDLANALMWRAVAARWEGDQNSASELYRRAFVVQNRMKTPHNVVGFGAIIYHETNENWDEALRVAQNELRVLRAHKLTFAEAKLRLVKCELLRRAGRDWAREAARLRAVAARLPSEEHWLGKLAELANDGS